MDTPKQPVSDAQRVQALRFLGAHLDVGTISVDEFKLRTHRIAESTCVQDLDNAFIGLPVLPEYQGLDPIPSLSYPGKSQELSHNRDDELHLYEVLCPWDLALGRSPLTLRKVRHMGWVLATAMALFTFEPLSLFFHESLESLFFFTPLVVMLIASVLMAPSKPKIYRRVDPPQHPHGPGLTSPYSH